MNIDDKPGLDDDVWPYLVQTKLTPYLESVRSWWATIDQVSVSDTGIYEILDAPPGLMFRFTRTAIRSPIKGVQAFPFVPAGYLQILNVQGGVNKMLERVCMHGLKLEEFTIVLKHGLPATYVQGHILAFVPTDILNNTKLMGQWIYLTQDEMVRLMKGNVSETVRAKLVLKI